MKGIYIAPIDNTLYTWSLGVSNKINGQIKAFSKLCDEMHYLRSDDGKLKLNDNYLSDRKINSKLGYTFLSIQFFNRIYKEYGKDLLTYDFIYIRYSFANPCFVKLIKYLHSHNKKVFVEIPTYPYKDEFKKNIYGMILKKIDSLCLINISKNIFRFVLTSNLPEIHGTRAINIFNGIDEDITLFENKQHKSTAINMIAIANLSPWHGYDRLIKGLADYYKLGGKIPVYLNIIGDGQSKSLLLQLTKDLNLQDKVKFLGAKRGDELDEVYMSMDIGVSSLALFRAGGGHDPIKSKEYVGRGIPVILGYEDRALSNKNLPFVFEVSANETNINMFEIIQQYHNLKYTSDEIKDYARRKLTWLSQMIKVINSLKD